MKTLRLSDSLGIAVLCFCCRIATADIALHEPADGDVFQTMPCPVQPCTAQVPLRVTYDGQPAERIKVVFTRQNDGRRIERSLCFFDQIEGISCPPPPNNFNVQIILQKGTWTAIPQSVRNNIEDFGNSVTFTVEDVTLTPAGPVRLSHVEPVAAASRLLLRETGNGLDALFSESEVVRIVGQNLDEATNPFLEVYLSPIPIPDPSVAAASALPTGDWCLYKAEIQGSGTLPDGNSFLDVLLPELPATTPDKCTVPPRPEGSIFTAKWRWVIRDKWIRQEREHATWAINSPRDVPWKDAPVFRVTKPPYPLVDGFGFDNDPDKASYKEFLTVFGNNAYVCVDCVPLVGCACVLPRIPDPLYHLLWHPIYKEVIDSTDGSCNGMAATSLLLARGEMETEQFNELVRHPAGFEDKGAPPTYSDSNFCTPFCSPPKPKNLWAHIRMNHGVQFSREFLFEVLDTLGDAIIDPDGGQVFNGVPNATKSRIEDNPLGFVSCFFATGNGHCVTPYGVSGNTIHIYDNNNSLKVDREIIVSGGDYSYPKRTKEPNSGNAFVAFPISIWKEGRHLLGFSDATKLFNGDLVSFLISIAVGDAEMEIVTENGSLGFDDAGNRTDFVQGGFLVPLMGPSDAEQRQLPAILAMNQSAPLIRIHAKGERYAYHTGADGQLIQLTSNSAEVGSEDQIQLEYEDQSLTGLTFKPESDAGRITPQVGLVIGDGQRALFRYSGVRVAGGDSAGFGGDIERRAVRFTNKSGSASHPVITLDRTGGDYIRTSFGPFNVANGATHELILKDWPNVDSATSTIDLDSDGNVDATETVDGQALPVPENLGQSADVAVSIEGMETATADSIAFEVMVKNLGPDQAADALIRVSVDGGLDSNLIQSSGGQCTQVGTQHQCAYADLNSGAIKSMRLEAPTDKSTITVTAVAYSSSLDLDSSNDSQTVTVGKREVDYRWWSIIFAVLLILLVIYYLVRRSS